MVTIPGMTRSGAGRAVLLAALVAAGCGAPKDGGDCAQAKDDWGPGGPGGSASLGERCSAGTYGSCDTIYDNCVDGVCKHVDSAGADVCTLGCTSSSECGGWYCKGGYCQPAYNN